MTDLIAGRFTGWIDGRKITFSAEDSNCHALAVPSRAFVDPALLVLSLVTPSSWKFEINRASPASILEAASMGHLRVGLDPLAGCC